MDELYQLQRSNEMAFHNERMRVVAIDKEAAEFRRQTEKIKFDIAQEELAQLKRRKTTNGIHIFSPLNCFNGLLFLSFSSFIYLSLRISSCDLSNNWGCSVYLGVREYV